MRSLIVGIDSGIARPLAQLLRADGWEVHGTSRRGTAGTIPLDLGHLPSRIELPTVEVAFLCAAMTRLADCRQDEGKSWAINVQAPTAIAESLVAAGTQVVLLSTNAVFDGTRPSPPTEATPPCPVNVYGRQKAEAERLILAMGGAAVLRLTKVLTPTLPLFTNWIAALRAGQPVKAFTDLVMAPIALTDVTFALKRIAETRSTGVFQASATRDISYAEACCHLAGRLGAPASLVCKTSAVENGIPPGEVPPTTSLDSTRLSALVGKPPSDPMDVIDQVFSLSTATT